MSAFPLVLERARSADIRLTPFPHLVLENALPQDLYDRLQATKPDFGLAAKRDHARENQRIAFFADLLLGSPIVDGIWKAFITAHTARPMLDRVFALFGAHLPQHAPHLQAWRTAHPEPRLGLLNRDPFDHFDVVLDCRAEFMTPVRSQPSSHRRGHLDTANRLYSGLLYMREPGDDTDPPGDLDLFAWADGVPRGLDRLELPDAELVPAGSVPYAANTFVLFPNSPFALHGAGLRGPGNKLRAYVFITAEVAQDLFQ